MPLSPSMSWLALGLGLFVLWQIVKRLPWEEVSETEEAVSRAPERGAASGITGGTPQDMSPHGPLSVSLTSLRAGERGQAGAPFDWSNEGMDAA